MVYVKEWVLHVHGWVLHVKECISCKGVVLYVKEWELNDRVSCKGRSGTYKGVKVTWKGVSVTCKVVSVACRQGVLHVNEWEWCYLQRRMLHVKEWKR